MRLVFLSVLCVLLTACSQRAVRNTDDQAGPSAGFHEVVSNGGAYRVRYQTRPQPIPMNEPFAIDVEIEPVTRNGDEGQPSEIMLHVDADMPEHGHGMNTRPQVERRGPGRFAVSGMLFHMPGYWEVYLDITRDHRTERAQFEVTLE